MVFNSKTFKTCLFFSFFLIVSLGVSGQSVKTKTFPEKEYNNSNIDFYQVYTDANSTYFIERATKMNKFKILLGGSNKTINKLFKYDNKLNEIFSKEYTETDFGGDYDFFQVVTIGGKMMIVVSEEIKKGIRFKYASVDMANGTIILPMKDLATFDIKGKELTTIRYYIQRNATDTKLCLVQSTMYDDKQQFNVTTFDGLNSIQIGNVEIPKSSLILINPTEIIVGDSSIYFHAKHYKAGKRKKDDAVFSHMTVYRYAFSGALSKQFNVPDSFNAPLHEFTKIRVNEKLNRMTVLFGINSKDLLVNADKLGICRYNLLDAAIIQATIIDFSATKQPLPALQGTSKKGNETGELSYEIDPKPIYFGFFEEGGKTFIAMQGYSIGTGYIGSPTQSGIQYTRTKSYLGNFNIFCFDEQLKSIWSTRIPCDQMEEFKGSYGGFYGSKYALNLDITQSTGFSGFASLPLFGGTAFMNDSTKLRFVLNQLPANVLSKYSLRNPNKMETDDFKSSNLYSVYVDKKTGEVSNTLILRNSEELLNRPSKAFLMPGGGLLIPAINSDLKGPLKITFTAIK